MHGVCGQVPPQPNITPPTRPAFLEIVAVGCRNLLPYALMPMSLPHLKFLLDTHDGTLTGATSESKAPAPDNPNFLERIVLPVHLPENPIFCPALRIAAFDSRLGGMSTPNVGNCRVPLTHKCPWAESYVPPRQLTAVDAAPPTPPQDDDAAPARPPGPEEAAAETPAPGAATAETSAAGAGAVDDAANAAPVEAPVSEAALANELVIGGLEAGVAADSSAARGGSSQVSAAAAADDGSGPPALRIKGAGSIDAGSPGADGQKEEEGEDDDDWLWNEHAATFLNLDYDRLATAAPTDAQAVQDELAVAVRPVDDGTGVFGDLPRCKSLYSPKTVAPLAPL